MIAPQSGNRENQKMNRKSTKMIPQRFVFHRFGRETLKIITGVQLFANNVPQKSASRPAEIP